MFSERRREQRPHRGIGDRPRSHLDVQLQLGKVTFLMEQSQYSIIPAIVSTYIFINFV